MSKNDELKLFLILSKLWQGSYFCDKLKHAKGDNMQSIRTEYRKGVLFIRLKGGITDNDLRYVNEIVDNFGIRYIVLNITNLNYVSLENIGHIIKYNERILKKKKKLLICDANMRRNQIFRTIIPNIEREIDAFSLI